MSSNRKLFVNLVVADLPRARAFFEALLLSFNPQFSNHEAACLVLGESAYCMLHSPASMARFSSLPPADPRTQIAGIYAFSADTREEVDIVTGGTSKGGY